MTLLICQMTLGQRVSYDEKQSTVLGIQCILGASLLKGRMKNMILVDPFQLVGSTGNAGKYRKEFTCPYRVQVKTLTHNTSAKSERDGTYHRSLRKFVPAAFIWLSFWWLLAPILEGPVSPAHQAVVFISSLRLLLMNHPPTHQKPRLITVSNGRSSLVLANEHLIMRLTTPTGQFWAL